jgi:hypothetical protein
VNSDEVWDLLELIASIDRRKLGVTDRQVWEGLIGDLPAADAQAAVIAYYRDSHDWIMPADVRTRAKAIRRDRIEREVVPAPPHELTDEPGRYQKALQARVKEIADGRSVLKAIGPLPSESPPLIGEVRKALGPALPPPERSLPPEEIARRQAAESRATRSADAATAPRPETGEPAA